ncbi:MAG TPA: carbamoyl phosphate synthase large subunit, partial [Pirellulaceae bacterium]|nr:carbamoyl phosphate synthase large subunit [Pirellulaceae bacterium]
RLHRMGYEILATEGTAKRLEQDGIPVQRVKKIIEGHPNLLDFLKNGQVDLILNTPVGKGARTDEGKIRATAVQYGVPCITTMPAAEAAVEAIETLRQCSMEVQSLQDRFPNLTASHQKTAAEPIH